MLQTFQSTRGMVTSPHHLASQSGLDILKKGGTALEAVTAMAATLSAVYPHMTGLGGDAFWLIAYPDGRIQVLDACGGAAQGGSIDLYRQQGHDTMPWRGGLAANTMAGAVSGWQAALQCSAALQTPLPVRDLLNDAIWYARNGYAVSESEAHLLAQKGGELLGNAAFADSYAPNGHTFRAGEIRKNPALATTLQHMADQGLDSFYTGDIADLLLADLRAAGSPLAAGDFARHAVEPKTPLHTRLSGVHVYNTPPPTQGVASLAILDLFERLNVAEGEGFAHIHGLVEATKRAFMFRNAHVGDPRWMTRDAQAFLDDKAGLSALAAGIDRYRAMPWPVPSQQGDTTWMGAIDGTGLAVSMIQSLYFEFGSGVFLPRTGLLWQNRGASFQLEPGAWNAYEPGRKPFHTLNPALARFDDGRVMVYGTMGGEGQPQTQAAIFTRYARFGMGLQQAVIAPRWLLGRTWGSTSNTLKVESTLNAGVVARLEQAGHVVERVAPFSSLMGHAGAVVRHASGLFEGASDPRSDGCAAGF
ncbi:MAG: gamma-glutamyltransferase family protein [Acetobacter sp.]